MDYCNLDKRYYIYCFRTGVETPTFLTTPHQFLAGYNNLEQAEIAIAKYGNSKHQYIIMPVYRVLK